MYHRISYYKGIIRVAFIFCNLLGELARIPSKKLVLYSVRPNFRFLILLPGFASEFARYRPYLANSVPDKNSFYISELASMILRLNLLGIRIVCS